MRGIYFVIFCSFLTIIGAYPMDYDEESADTAKQALDDLRKLVLSGLGDVHMEFANKKTVLLIETQKRLENVYDTFRQYRRDIELYIYSINGTSITRCFEEVEIIPPDAFLESLNATCDNPADIGGMNYRRLEDEKKSRYFYTPYIELVNNLENCLNFSDIQPHICAGLVTSTSLEVERLSLDVAVQPLQFNIELDKQLLAFSECAAAEVTDYANQMSVWHNTFITCVEDLINMI